MRTAVPVVVHRRGTFGGSVLGRADPCNDESWGGSGLGGVDRIRHRRIPMVEPTPESGRPVHIRSLVDAGATSADSSERFWDGLRKRGVSAASSQEDAGGDALDEADLVAARKKMGKFGVNPKDLAYICSPCGYNQLMDLPNVKTLETYGSSATILAGELGRIFGIPVIVSEYMRDDLNASGVNDGVTTDRTAILLVNRKRYMMGLRRALQIRIERNQTDRDATDMVSFSRYAFNGVLEADGSNYASESSLAYIINILA